MNYDVAVLGAGAGGATSAFALARAGYKTLLIDADSPQEPFHFNGTMSHPFVGYGLGGSTALFGAALVRPGPADFVPGSYYSKYIDRSVWEWPVGLDEYVPYFEQAEDLMNVAGDHTIVIPHLSQRRNAYRGQMFTLSKHNQKMRDVWYRADLSSFPLPLAIDPRKCKVCDTCPGKVCPTGARSSAASLLANSHNKFTQNCEIWRGYQAIKLISHHTKVKSVVLESSEGRQVTISARIVIVACGATQSPLLLMRSAIKDPSDQLGRNFMFHLGVLGARASWQSKIDLTHFQKQLGTSEYYLGCKNFSHKLGLIQSIPLPDTSLLKQKIRVEISPRLWNVVRRRVSLLALMIEDLPRATNRIFMQSGRVLIDHSFHYYDIFRAHYGRLLLNKLLGVRGNKIVGTHVATFEREHLAHQVGTCRFGRSPQHSVLDPDCRVHSYDNLYVIDGSFMPTSLGVGPALMIIANALRVCDKIVGGRLCEKF